jgi:hypothetical protein
MRSAKHGADYITFICNVPREFTPRLNHEHSERKSRGDSAFGLRIG